MKGKTVTLSIFGILVGRILNRILGNYFGVNGPLTLVLTIITLFMVCDLYLVIRRRFFAALVIFVCVFPLLIGFIGMYIDNSIVLLCGICLIFIVYPLFIKWFKGLVIVNKSNLWNHKGLW